MSPSKTDSCMCMFFETSRNCSICSRAICEGICPERLFADTSRWRRNIKKLSVGVGSSPFKLLFFKSTEIRFLKFHNFVEILPNMLQSLTLRMRKEVFVGFKESNRLLKFTVSFWLPPSKSTSSDFDANVVPACSDIKLFSLKSATWSPGMAPMLLGICPEKSFFAKCKCCKSVMLPIVEGMFPVKWFPERRHCFIAGKNSPNSSGKVPWRPARERCK